MGVLDALPAEKLAPSWGDAQWRTKGPRPRRPGRIPAVLRLRRPDRDARVPGDLRTYKIHLGSGTILTEPNDACLCIVPRGSADRVFLPSDTAITDPSITRQLQP